jgi:hypothetical protein|tara:strand:- start:726 stop:1817 length:1092 start_codon:yes stop_codon:yes gene_type:complete
MGWSGGTFTRTNGVHTGTRIWEDDRDAGTKIVADRHDTNDNDLATGINTCLTKDGQNAATANLNIGSYRLTATGDATAHTDAINAGQLQDGGLMFQATDTGSADAYVIALAPVVTAYVAGQEFNFKAGATSTGASTLNVNGLGVKNIKKMNDQNIAAGDIEADAIIKVVYDGTSFQMLSQVGTSGMTSFTLTGDSGSNQTIDEASTMDVAGGTGIDTVVGATDTVTVSVDSNVCMLNATANFADNIVQRPIIKDYGEVHNAIGDTGGGSDTIDLTSGNVVSATVSTGAQTFVFSNPTASANSCSFTLLLTNAQSQGAITWPASVDWAGGAAPTLTASGLDILVFTTIDGGTIWHGAVASTDSK